MAPDTADPRRDRTTFVAAARFVAGTVVVAVLVLCAALAWVNGCGTDAAEGALDNCTTLQRHTLAVGPAAILTIGGIGAFVRTYLVWRARGGWWVWQGAGWFLLVLMLVVLSATAPTALL